MNGANIAYPPVFVEGTAKMEFSKQYISRK